MKGKHFKGKSESLLPLLSVSLISAVARGKSRCLITRVSREGHGDERSGKEDKEKSNARRYGSPFSDDCLCVQEKVCELP